MRQISLVAFYGEKPSALCELIVACQQRLAAGLGRSFRPADVRQVHATIIGLERADTTVSVNRNLLAYRGRAEPMDVAGMLRFLRGGGLVPFQIQLGGFLDCAYPFTSRGARPYVRSFSIQGGRAVLVGWPVLAATAGAAEGDGRGAPRAAVRYPSTLQTLRQALQRYNILHAYHRTATDVDNDFYLRLGVVDAPVSQDAAGRVEHDLRQALAQSRPVRIDVTLEHIFVASYADDTMPLDSTWYRPIADMALDAEAVMDLYEGQAGAGRRRDAPQAAAEHRKGVRDEGERPAAG